MFATGIRVWLNVFKGWYYLSLVVKKPVFGVSDLVPHKPGFTATEDGYSLEISDIDRRGIVLSM